VAGCSRHEGGMRRGAAAAAPGHNGGGCFGAQRRRKQRGASRVQAAVIFVLRKSYFVLKNLFLFGPFDSTFSFLSESRLKKQNLNSILKDYMGLVVKEAHAALILNILVRKRKKQTIHLFLKWCMLRY
jgi:hypothetical protein